MADNNARVRDNLWKKIVEDWQLNAIMIYSTNTEQSYQILSNGDPDREVLDFDGISLICKPVKKAKARKT